MQLLTYLNFRDNCAEAMRFYADVLGGELVMMTFGQMPPSEHAPELAEYERELIMHAELRVCGQTLMASDSLPQFCGGNGYQPQQSVNVVARLPELAEAERIFHALSEGGQITVPFAATFFSPGFGSLKDRFGTSWLVMAECPN